ncbi:UNVERIFIED_CONTAM: hypothetical protein RMT77_015830 [Armadillidium vulgare]
MNTRQAYSIQIYKILKRANFKYIILFVLFFIYFVFFNDTNEQTIENYPTITEIATPKSTFQTRRKNWKKILLWTDFFASRDVWNTIFKRLTAGECEVSNCKVILDRREIKNVDAVLFNAYNLRMYSKQPAFLKGHIYHLPYEETRSPEQIYIFYSMEPPTKLDQEYISAVPKNYFNWTMGYRRDSDIFEPFGIVNPKHQKSERNVVNYLTEEELEKKKLLIWIGSACYKHQPFIRENFVELIKKEFRLDIFGRCGQTCDDYSGLNIYGNIIGGNPCDQRIPNYAFYLAVENSLCDDYVTEKIYKAWHFGVIPVVIGKVNYSMFAPPKSYIDYRDFSSIAELIAYLKKVASNASLYNEYLKWKEDYDYEAGSPYNPLVCDLCRKLHEQKSTRVSKSYEDIYDWFVTQSNCIDSFEETKHR